MCPSFARIAAHACAVTSSPVTDAYVRGLEGAWQRPFPKVAA
jgi:hypothetical protein